MGKKDKRVFHAASPRSPEIASSHQNPTLLRYPGGKTRAVKTLSEYLPKNGVPTVISPFLGGASFEIYLNNHGIPVIAGDKFHVLSDFWKTIENNDHKAELTKRLNVMVSSGVTKDYFTAAQKRLQEHEVADECSLESQLNAAVDFFIVNRCSFSGATLSGGFSPAASTKRFTPSSVERIESWDNPLLKVSNLGFEELMSNSLTGSTDNNSADQLLFFLDPPYMLPGYRNSLYGDRGSLHDGFDHDSLSQYVQKAHDAGHLFILTYNDAPELRELYSKFTIDNVSWAYGMNKSKESDEVIITNIPVEQRLEADVKQSPTLF